ncbi:MAG: hypothetical protein J5767_07320 [Paludibacteraceae bacterium]|nr:hypothetical protein [Paludibacteraceae bacterium]
MSKKCLLFMALLWSVCFMAKAQEWNVPAYSFEGVQPGDPEGRYAKFNDDIIKCHDWLQNTPIGTDEMKRIEAKRFLLKWSFGCTQVTIVIHSDLMYADRSENELLVSFIGGWSKYALQHLDRDKDEIAVDAAIAGIEAEIDLYKKNEKTFSSNKELKKKINNFISLKKKNKLRDYVKSAIDGSTKKKEKVTKE